MALSEASAPEVTHGHLLGGRVHYAQPRSGFRSGIEPVLLAAAVPARPGERVLEAGSGAGAALLCLAARVAGISGLGVERDPALTAIATRNAAANGWHELAFLAADIADLPASLMPDVGAPDIGLFDHGFANPPYHPALGTASPHPARDAARRAPAGLFAVWAAAMGMRLRTRGTLTWIVTAAVLPACIAALTEAGCAPSALVPLWPRAGEAAKLVLLRGVKGGRGGFRVLPGLALHAGVDGFTPDAEAILRHGAALAI
jgi:tRNA1(Val) A37 N6-methylase TrmN6